MQARCTDLHEEEECTPLVVGEREELVIVDFANALVVHPEVVPVPLHLIHGDVHGVHPAILSSRFIAATVQNFTCSKWSFVFISDPVMHSIGCKSI